MPDRLSEHKEFVIQLKMFINQAEHIVRVIVFEQKVSGIFRTDKGSELISMIN